MNKSDNLSLLEVAIDYMNGKKTPQKVNKIIEDVLSIKGLDADDFDSMARLYSDITTSAKFVFCGDDCWDLKERQSLDLWDKDGSYFNEEEEEIIEEETDDNLTLDDYNLDEEKDEDEEEEEDEVEEGEVVVDDEPEEHDDEDFLDEKQYNDMMDDYEDLYEDK